MDNDFKLDLSQLSKEFLLLLQIMKLDTNKDLQESPPIVDFDWDEFIDLSKRHRVYPIIYKNIKRFGLNWIPQWVADKLHKHYLRNTFRMLELSGEMEKTCELFSENKIRTLMLKGPVLAVALYGDISMRTSSDIDLLVELKDLERAEQLLLENGYVKDDYIETILNDWKWRHHHFTFFHSVKKIKIEVHWRLNPGPAKEPKFEELWKRKQRSSLTHSPIYLLGNEDLFVFLITHGVRHGWSRLRWLLDVNQLMTQKLDYYLIFALLRKYHYLHLAGKANLLANQLLDTPINDQLKPLIGSNSCRLANATMFYFKEKVNLHTEPLPVHVAKYHTSYLFASMSIHNKCLFLLSALHPYPIDRNTLPLPNQLHFLYFPLRPILSAWRKTRDLQFSKGSLK